MAEEKKDLSSFFQWAVGILITIILAGISYNVNQLTRRLEVLEQYGTPGMRERIARVEVNVDNIETILSAIEKKQDVILDQLEKHRVTERRTK